MSELINKQITWMQAGMDKSILHAGEQLNKIRAGRANPVMLADIRVAYHGANLPLDQVGSVSSPDARTLTISPWEKSMLAPIEKAITAANMGLNPQNDGIIIRINVPALTEETRKELVKKASAEAENSKTAIRNLRRESNDKIKKLDKEGVAKDAIKTAEAAVQKITDAYIKQIDALFLGKEKELLTI